MLFWNLGNTRTSQISMSENTRINRYLAHEAFVAFFHVASLFSTGVDNKKVGVDNEKALELTNSTVFHKASRLSITL